MKYDLGHTLSCYSSQTRQSNLCLCQMTTINGEFVEHQSLTEGAQQSVTKIIVINALNLVSEARAFVQQTQS